MILSSLTVQPAYRVHVPRWAIAPTSGAKTEAIRTDNGSKFPCQRGLPRLLAHQFISAISTARNNEAPAKIRSA